MTVDRLERQAIHYLQRFPSSIRHFQRIMRRKLERAEARCPGEPHKHGEWLDAVQARCVSLGLLNDAQLAQGLARSMTRKGRSTRQIRADLRRKGFLTPDIDRALAIVGQWVHDAGSVSADFIAALRYARKRRFGPFTRGALDFVLRRKQMASLARKGFSFEIVRTVMEMSSDDHRLDLVDLI